MKKLLIISTAVAIALLAQDPIPPSKNTFLQYTVQTRPIAVPTGLTDLIAQNAYLCSADFTGTGQNILVQDKQGTPVIWINNVLGSSGSPSTFIYTAPSDSACRYFPGGISWQANSTGVTGYITIKCAVQPCKLLSGY